MSTVEADDSKSVACDALTDDACGVTVCDGSTVDEVSRLSVDRLGEVASEVASADDEGGEGIGRSIGSISFLSSIV